MPLYPKNRDLETMLLTLSKFYFETDPIRKESEKLVWFGEKGAFKVAVGGDSAPFGKWVESVSWLVSFLKLQARMKISSCFVLIAKKIILLLDFLQSS